jgi:hypothetical protein
MSVTTDQAIETHLQAMESVKVTDVDSAHKVIVHATSAIAAINQRMHPHRRWTRFPIFDAADDLLEKLEQWLERILKALASIAATTFVGLTYSITVGTTLSLTINIPSIDAPTEPSQVSHTASLGPDSSIA